MQTIKSIKIYIYIWVCVAFFVLSLNASADELDITMDVINNANVNNITKSIAKEIKLPAKTFKVKNKQNETNNVSEPAFKNGMVEQMESETDIMHEKQDDVEHMIIENKEIMENLDSTMDTTSQAQDDLHNKINDNQPMHPPK